jgi:endoglucanase
MTSSLRRILVFLFIAIALSANGQSTTLPFGIKLCGPEFGQEKFPGSYGVDFIYPNKAELVYFYSKGFRLVDLPFKWERIQPVLGADLDSTEWNRLDTFLLACDSIGISVKLTLQNFGRYYLNGKNAILGSNELPVVYLEDVWKKLAIKCNGKTNIYGFQIMNEPHDMKQVAWFEIAQKAINAIRAVDKGHTIFVSGDNYSNSVDWKINNNKLKDLVDSCDNLVYEAHCYFDKDFTGQYLSRNGTTLKAYEHNAIGARTGVQAVKPFVKWLNKYHKKGFVGEYGVPDDDPRWLPMLDKFLNYISSNGINGAYWAAGPWWGEYRLSVEPRDGQDRPQMQVLAKYLFSEKK